MQEVPLLISGIPQELHNHELDGLPLIIGGALGNLYDRLIHGYVVDFLSFHAAGWYYPAFNVADIGITLGAIGLIWESVMGERRRKKAAHSSSS